MNEERLMPPEMLDILKNAKEADGISVDDFVYRLEVAKDGANVHTVNKAIFYLKEFSANEAERFKYSSNYDRLHELKCYVLSALKTNDFRKLSAMMRGWW